jgi:hypothetical protein
MFRYPLFIVFLALVLCVGAASAQTKRALLIGINNYDSKGVAHAAIQTKESDGPNRWSTQEWPSLKGAINDVKAMQALLSSPKFGFPNDKEHIHLLLQNDATHDRILADMQKYLVDLPAKGDIVVFYYSGHGSLRVNSLSQKYVVCGKGDKKCDNTIVPVDANSSSPDVRDREIARIFNAALDKGVILTAIFDSCHSGMMARGIPVGSPSRTRFLPYDPRDIREAPDMKDGKEVPAPADRADNAALVLSASLSNQLAKEWDANNESHGAFTVALIAALESLPADIPSKDLFKRISVVMKGMGVVDQEPLLDGVEQRRQQPLFGKGSATGKLRVASEGMDDDGVVLNAGFSDSLGKDSELIRVGGPSVRIKIDHVDGLTKSHAKIMTPANAKVETGDLFELDKWVPEETTLLPIWMPPGNLSAQQIQDAVTQLATLKSNSKLIWVDDPVEQSPTHTISWDGTQWQLRHTGSPEVLPLSATLQASSLAAQLNKPDVKLLVSLPPSNELVKQLDLARPDVPIKILNEPDSALYTLVGAFDGTQVRYAWVNRTAFEAAKTIATTNDDAGGCTTDSPYPIRTKWVALSPKNTQETAGQSLAGLALRLDKVYAWLNLPTPPADDFGPAFPYHLALRRRSDKSYLDNGQTVEGDQLDLLLKSDSEISPQTPARWVYVLAIDCNGAGVLLYPRNGVESKYPREGATETEISVLRGGFLRVTPPFGTDTYIMLTTDEQLPDPSVLEFEGVKGVARGSSPLQSLLGSASHGTRGSKSEMPTTWSVQRIHVTSSPKPAKTP